MTDNPLSDAGPFTLRLTAIAHGGEALGRHEGKVVFVPYSIPGEVVRVQVVEEKARWARAQLLEVLEASPDRVEPPCPYFGPGRCGGCQWQHIAYPRQLALKQEIVSDQLQRLGHVSDPPVQPTHAVGEPWGYRNHVQFAVDAQGRIGLRRASSHQVIPVDRCLLLHPLLDELHSALDLEWPELARLSLRAGTATGEQMLILEAKEGAAPELEVDLPLSIVLLDRYEPPLILAGNAYIEEKVASLRFRVSAGSFFQVNTPGAEALLETVVAFLEPHAGDRLLDGYCGVGLFSLPLAGRVAEVVGIETAPSAAFDFIWNAEALGLEDVTLIEGPVEEVLAAWVEAGKEAPPPPAGEGDARLGSFGQQIDLAVVDPPRRGMGPEALAALVRMGPRRVAYVSCDPATLARDAQAFMQAGYRLTQVQPVDMFPQTYHVESVGLYVRTE
jgi:23S rRNA (uracil1939-C5)-methyltransferase